MITVQLARCHRTQSTQSTGTDTLLMSPGQTSVHPWPLTPASSPGQLRNTTEGRTQNRTPSVSHRGPDLPLLGQPRMCGGWCEAGPGFSPPTITHSTLSSTMVRDLQMSSSHQSLVIMGQFRDNWAIIYRSRNYKFSP